MTRPIGPPVFLPRLLLPLPLSPPSPFFLLSLIVSKKEKNVPNVAYVKRLAYFRLFVEGSTILDHVTTPSLLIIGMTNKNVGPIIH